MSVKGNGTPCSDNFTGIDQELAPALATLSSKDKKKLLGVLEKYTAIMSDSGVRLEKAAWKP